MEETQNCELFSSSETFSEMGPEKFKEILRRNNIQDPVSEVVIKESGLKGENMASLTYCVTIRFEDSKLDPLHLFVKRLPNNQAHLAMVTDSKLFKKEAMFFMEYLPEVEKICRKFRQENLIEIYPKSYYGDKHLVVLENLVLNKGFTLLNKEDFQDFNAAQFALATLAKHHAISYAYIKQIGGPEQFFKRFTDFDFLGFDNKTVRSLLVPSVEDPIGISISTLSKSSQEGKEKAIEILKGYEGIAYEKFLEPLKRNFDSDENRIRVLNHGDYWNSNMMFLKDNLDGSKLCGHVMIDLQLVNYCTPGVDLGYYLFSSVKPEVRQTRLKEMLEGYLDVLVKTTKDLGYPIKMTYEELFKDFRETFIHGFLMGLGLCTGIAFAVLGDADPTDIDMNEFASIYGKLVEKWIVNNPEKNEENAKLIISVVKEHQNLILA